MHYVLDCPLDAVPRIKLPEEFSGLLQPLGVDIYTNKEVTTNTLLNGVTNLGCVRGQYHTNNEQTQSVEGII